MTPNYTTAADVFDGWRDDLLTGRAPTLYPCGTDELGRFELGPGLVCLVGGAPGSGKTALTMQLVCDALTLTPTLRAVVCNVEMPPSVLLDRQLARLAGLDAGLIRRRILDASHGSKLEAGLAVLVVAAVGRTKDARGRSSYDANGLNLASFRESSELEFNADDAFILAPDPKDAEFANLMHLKSRHGETRDIRLQSGCRLLCARCGARPPPPTITTETTMTSRIPDRLRDAWDSTPAAMDDDDATGSPNTRANKAKGTAAKRQAGDRFGVLNAFVDFTLRELTRAETAVWLLLWRDTKGDGLAKTSQADIGRRAGLHIATVKRTVAKLCRRGLLTVVRRGNLRRGPSVYRVRPLTNDYQK